MSLDRDVSVWSAIRLEGTMRSPWGLYHSSLTGSPIARSKVRGRERDKINWLWWVNFTLFYQGLTVLKISLMFHVYIHAQERDASMITPTHTWDLFRKAVDIQTAWRYLLLPLQQVASSWFPTALCTFQIGLIGWAYNLPVPRLLVKILDCPRVTFAWHEVSQPERCSACNKSRKTMQHDNRWLFLLLCVCSVCVKCTVSNILLSFAQNFLESKVLPTEFQRLDRILQGFFFWGGPVNELVLNHLLVLYLVMRSALKSPRVRIR